MGRLVAGVGAVSVVVACSSSNEPSPGAPQGSVGAICPNNPECSAITVNGTSFPTTVDETTWEECGACEYDILVNACVEAADGGLSTPYLSLGPSSDLQCFLAELLLCQQKNGYYATTQADLTGKTLAGICAQSGSSDCLNLAVATANGSPSSPACPAITAPNTNTDDDAETPADGAVESGVAETTDATTDAAASPDATVQDASPDATAQDAAPEGSAPDATSDASSFDTGSPDANPRDAAPFDASPHDAGSEDAPQDAAVEASIDAGTVVLQITGGPLTCGSVSGDGTSVACTTGTLTNAGSQATGGLTFNLASPFTEGNNTSFCAPETNLGPGQSCTLRIVLGPINTGTTVVLATKGTYDQTLTVNGVNGGSASTGISGTITCSGDNALEADEVAGACTTVSDCCTDDNPVPSCVATDSGSRVCN